MLRNLLVYLIPLCCFALLTNIIFAQQPSLAIGDSAGKRLEILEAKRYNYQKIDSTGDFVSLAGSVRIRQGNTLFYADSAVLDQKQNIFEAFGNIHINDEDSVHTYSQYLKYYGKEKDAILKERVKLTDGKGVLTTNELHYNTITKIGTYVNGGKVVTGTTVLNSTEGIYYGETKDIYFKKKVVMVDPEFKVLTDTLLFNTFTEIARFTVPTTIINKQRTIKTSEGYYDMKNKKAVFGKRPFIDDKDYTLTATDIAMDEASGFGDALGNAVYRSKDTSNPFTIVANRLQSNSKSSALLATQKPIMIIKQGADSIYLSADTLYSAKLTDLRKTRNVPVIMQAPDTSQVILDSTMPVSNTTDIFANGRNKAAPDSSQQPTNDSLSVARGKKGFDIESKEAPSKGVATPAARGKGKPAAREKNNIATVKPLGNANNGTAATQDSTIAKSSPITTRRVTSSDTTESSGADSSNNRFVEAYFNVKIFSDSMQAVGDSMFYSFEDSAFRLFKSPAVWAQENQITGDTIYLFISDRKPKRLYVFENALAINKVDEFYNQIKGNTINGYFINGNIDNIRARGSAENIYYAADEQGNYIGVNRSTSDIIDMYFLNRKPKKVVFRNNLQGTTSPMRQVDHSTMRLRGFKWLENRRPRSKSDLFGS